MTRHPRFLLAAGLLVLAVMPFARAAEGDEPPYPHGDFTGDCTQCHQSDRWVPAKPGPDFKHAAAFPLKGAHRTAKCRDCHLSLDFTMAPAACADCHKDPHLGELGNDCARCHTPRNFIDRSRQLDSHRATRFPLTGAHVTVECESCHVAQPQGALKWVNAPVDCVACHEALYDATTDPNHRTAAFPTDCALCHTPTTWQRARFNHDGTRFPLTGAHRALPCSSCHQNGYSGTPTDCYACHQADYNGTTDPNHAGAKFSTDCKLCHNTTSFQGATFAHDKFPIYSGRHAGRWSSCGDCHTNPSDYAVFSCFLCHSDADTTPRHSGVSGYSYNSQACYTCHPLGEAN